MEPGRVEDTQTYDGPMPCLMRTPDGVLLLVYRQSDVGHASEDARLIMRRSADDGRTWSNERTVHDVDDRDTGAPSFAISEKDNQIVLFDRAYEIEEVDDKDEGVSFGRVNTYKMFSTDGGRTWTEPVRIDGDLVIDKAWPFGGYVNTSNGLMTQFYSPSGEVEVVFSTDGGRTWENNVVLVSSDERRELVEPVSWSIGKDRLILLGRENVSGSFYAVRSNDGGSSWSEIKLFDLGGGSTPAPLWAKRTGDNRVTVVWGDRDDLCVYATEASAHLVWQNPSVLENIEPKILHEYTGTENKASYWNGDAGDFGYPSFAQTGDKESDTIVTFYDGYISPDIWLMNLY